MEEMDRKEGRKWSEGGGLNAKVANEGIEKMERKGKGRKKTEKGKGR